MNVYVNYRTMRTRVFGDTYAPEQVGLPVPIAAGGTGSSALQGNSVLVSSALGTNVLATANLAYVNGNLDIGTLRVTTDGIHGFAPGNVLVENADVSVAGKVACKSLSDGSATAIDVVPGTSFPRPLRFLQKEIELVRKGLASTWWPSMGLRTFAESTGSFAGAVTTPRNKIVLVPYDAPHVGLVDIHTRSFETFDASSKNAEFGSLARFKGGVLTRRGVVAMVPWNADYIGLFDPFAKTFGAVATGSTGATNRFLGGALLPNGRIVFAPYDAPAVLTYDEATNSVAQIALPGSVTGSAKYAGAVSLPSGNVCFVPHAAQRVAIVQANGMSLQEVGGTLSGGNKYVGGVLVPSGKVVFVPYNATSVGVFDPETGITTAHGNLPGNAKYAGGFLTPDGKVLFVPHDAPSIGVFDPEMGTMSYVALPGAFSGTAGKFFGGAFGSDGYAYLASHGHADVCMYGMYPISDAVPWHHPYVNGSL